MGPSHCSETLFRKRHTPVAPRGTRDQGRKIRNHDVDPPSTHVQGASPNFQSPHTQIHRLICCNERATDGVLSCHHYCPPTARCFGLTSLAWSCLKRSEICMRMTSGVTFTSSTSHMMGTTSFVCTSTLVSSGRRRMKLVTGSMEIFGGWNGKVSSKDTSCIAFRTFEYFCHFGLHS